MNNVVANLGNDQCRMMNNVVAKRVLFLFQKNDE